MRILIVENERDLLRNISLALREEGYAVDSAGNGETGLHHALNYDYDAIILDVTLPKPDGWALHDRLRRAKLTPVLLLTSRDQIGDRIRDLDIGASDYVVKPFDFEELSARLRAIIRRNANQGRSVIEIGDVQIDTGKRLVSQAGQTIDLTAREYTLIEFLARHRGNVISRAQFYEHLAGENEDTASNLFDVHVFNVRRKLGARFIMTRRGHGYYIE